MGDSVAERGVASPTEREGLPPVNIQALLKPRGFTFAGFQHGSSQPLVARSPRQPCARFYRTVKLACVVNDPFGVVIVIKPLVAPLGTLTKTEGFNGNLYGMTQTWGTPKVWLVRNAV